MNSQELEKKIEELRTKARLEYGWYMQEECADMGYDAEASRNHWNKYREYEKEADSLQKELDKLLGKD